MESNLTVEWDEQGRMKYDGHIFNIVSDEARREVQSGERKGCHSSGHWFHVSQLGVLLAQLEGADTVVPLLFGFYHDCRRENDGYDPGHGPRASELVREHFEKGWLRITEDQMELLVYACEFHTSGRHHNSKTVGVCWDADRLTLPRVGTQTNPEYLNTETAKRLSMMQHSMYFGRCTCG